MGRRRKLEHIYNKDNTDSLNQNITSDFNNLNENVVEIKKEEEKISHLNLNDGNKSTNTEQLTEIPKKKRGRKPRYMTNGEPQPPKEKITKKRGRRPKEKYNFNTEPLVVTDHINESENIIVKLPVKISDLNQNEFINNLYSYNPQIKDPEPYDPSQDFNIIEKNQMNFSEYKKSPTNKDLLKKKKKTNNFETINEEKEEENENNKKPKRQIDLLLHNKYNKEKKIKLLTELSNNNSDCSYPNKTNISCFWCCHEFSNQPWGIPLSYTEKKFNLFGVFCSPQCACSYLFNSEEFAEKKWESYSLLNLLYKEVCGEFTKILPAPSKLCIIKFGGKIPIEKYREDLLQGNNIYLVKFPPVSSIIPVMEEVNLKKIQLKNNFIPVDKDRILKANQELRLKRSKPVNNKNTLDNCINILK